MSQVPTPTPTTAVAAFTDLAGPLEAPPPVAQVPTAAEREARLARLLATHFRMVWRALRRLGVQAHAVDDAAQEVFIVVSRKLAQITPEHERRFLYGVALRVAANARRARAARPETPDSDTLELAQATTPSPEVLLDRKRARELLDAALERLPDDLRTAFVLFELEGCSAPEVAELLDIPVGTATSRLRRAREAFHGAAGELRRRHAGGGEP